MAEAVEEKKQEAEEKKKEAHEKQEEAEEKKHADKSFSAMSWRAYGETRRWMQLFLPLVWTRPTTASANKLNPLLWPPPPCRIWAQVVGEGGNSF